MDNQKNNNSLMLSYPRDPMETFVRYGMPDEVMCEQEEEPVKSWSATVNRQGITISSEKKTRIRRRMEIKYVKK